MNTLCVRVWRTGADGSGGRFVAYDVPRLPAQTVLDVVTHIQRRIDSTLAYRFACRVGMCGSCAMTVNGRPRWTCRTHVSKVVEDGKVEIGKPINISNSTGYDNQPSFTPDGATVLFTSVRGDRKPGRGATLQLAARRP